MKKIYALFASLGMAVTAMAQPANPFYVAIDPDEIPALLANKPVIGMMRVDGAEVPTIDGTKDAVWDKVPAGTFSKYIRHYTLYSGGVYSKVSLLSDGDNTRRLPANDQDFKGTYRVIFDENNIYCFFDITDNEINDNTIRPGLWEEVQFQEAPYPDSAQQMLKSNPYPPYAGVAPAANMKYCYWAYLGAFKINYKLITGGNCEIKITEKPDAVKIDYSKRTAACNCAWKKKDDGTGYYQEVSMSLKVTLADSADNPFVVPATNKDTAWIAFDMGVYDRDSAENNDIQASWSAENSNVWDAMVYGGKLMMQGWTLDVKSTGTDEITFWPNPAVDEIRLSQSANVEIISIQGVTVRSAQNVNELNVADLVPGIYVVKINGTPAGKMLKQ